MNVFAKLTIIRGMILVLCDDVIDNHRPPSVVRSICREELPVLSVSINSYRGNSNDTVLFIPIYTYNNLFL